MNKRFFCIVISVFVSVIFFSCSNKTRLDSRIVTWGSRGGIAGKFVSPRAIDVNNEFVYVIDRLGRVQKFDKKGTYLLEWRIQPWENGTPTNLTLDSDGNLWIPDTHNSRILQYNPQGKLMQSFGEYGEELGKFVYPTGLTFGSQGDLFIVEYGVQDRVQVFTPDGKYKNLSWGSHGDGKEQFNRPMGIVRGIDNLLYIADAVNHRIAVYTEEGNQVRLIGKRGKAPGEMNFPYDIDIDSEGNLYIAEFGNHRIQKLRPDGTSLGVWGDMGSAPGQLAEPWGVAVGKKYFFVADTRNHRIQSAPISLLSLSN